MTGKSINNDIEKNSLFIRLVMIKEMSVIVPIIILIIVGICVNPNFLNKNNLWSLMRTASFMGIVAIPVGFLLTTKSLDLSVGQVVASSGIIFAILTIKLGVPLPLAVVLILIYASLVGLINGVLIVDVGLPAFLTTLGMQFVLSGITSYITKGEGFRGFPQWFTAIGQARFLGFVTAEMWVILFLAVVAYHPYQDGFRPADIIDRHQRADRRFVRNERQEHSKGRAYNHFALRSRRRDSVLFENSPGDFGDGRGMGSSANGRSPARRNEYVRRDDFRYWYRTGHDLYAIAY